MENSGSMAPAAHSKARLLASLMRDAFKRFQTDNAARMAAALSYYTVFSLAPLLIIATAIAGLFFGQNAAQGELAHQLSQVIGPEGARFVEQLVARTWRVSSNLTAMGLGVAILIYGASILFVELQDALNTIWDVGSARGGVKFFIRKHLFSFGMIVVMGVLLLGSLVFSSVVAGLHRIMGQTPDLSLLFRAGDFLAGLCVAAVFFALIFKILPDTKILWRDVWLGSIITATLFSCGKFLIGLYLGKAAITSVFGAAGSLIALLLWFNYSTQILLFGAEFTRVCADRRKSKSS